MSLMKPKPVNRQERFLPESGVRNLLEEEFASILSTTAEMRDGNIILLVCVLKHLGKNLERKRAKNICMLVQSLFGRRVTLKQV